MGGPFSVPGRNAFWLSGENFYPEPGKAGGRGYLISAPKAGPRTGPARFGIDIRQNGVDT